MKLSPNLCAAFNLAKGNRDGTGGRRETLVGIELKKKKRPCCTKKAAAWMRMFHNCVFRQM